ncbi:Holliday junction resolvase RuvX [Candidatus Falkowbacteria bacterium CG10_big_fil_rev_8_21_14_0_10_43_10]|uniref:Putative pre-16S rRNA nuclease n=1 Tax=Candidatus Falkowbacteria bacterium CG10_big_fil_rev_8_21_14_0_10_43_10 TaxID=1974567 RepID=A0A2H0V4Z8_9BACT|nr:MAG: Holliday junction resolvase RuvX [Candidatus Falkowbacteria bacterium CG10_big_fil_rev_8_21_14_0_10_43_10]
MVKKYLGVDYGTKRIGLAIGGSDSKTAVVFGTANNIDEIVKIVKEEDIDAVVLGKPYSVADRGHELPENFRKFAGELKSKISAEIIFEDERLSSKYADSLIGDKKTKASRDEIAAVSILQGHFDKSSK